MRSSRFKPWARAAVGASLTLGTWAMALPEITNLSDRPWKLTFGEVEDHVARLKPEGPWSRENAITVTSYVTARSVTISRKGACRSVVIKPRETVLLLARYPATNGLYEVLTLEDVDRRYDICSIFFQGPGRGRRTRPEGPGFVLHLNAYFEFAERFMTQGVVLKGSDQIHILAGTYAKVVGGKPADALCQLQPGMRSSSHRPNPDRLHFR